jgi:hypothetical protein
MASKPFGKGGFAGVKDRLLVVFLATENVDSDYGFNKVLPPYPGMACVTAEDHDALWQAVAALPSFHHTLGFSKMGRWFS